MFELQLVDVNGSFFVLLQPIQTVLSLVHQHLSFDVCLVPGEGKLQFLTEGFQSCASYDSLGLLLISLSHPLSLGDDLIDLVSGHPAGGFGVHNQAVLEAGLNIGGGDSQDPVSINGELVVKVVRSGRSGGYVVEGKLPENVVVLGQRSLT